MDRCDALLAPELGRSILSVIYPPVDDGALVETRFTQPALFAIEYSLAQLWRSWGIEPAAVMGHSLGEYVAACVAGVVSLEDGLRIAAARGRLMQALSAPGAMAAVFADEAAVRAAIAPHAAAVSIAALNGPGNTVISGAADAVAAIVAQFERDGIRATRLDVSHAFHSPLMEPMLDEFERVLSGVTWHPARIPIISNVTGTVAKDDDLSQPAYWRRHAREAVRFGEGIVALHEQGCRVFLEVGPSPTLLAMGRRAAGDIEALWVPSLRKGRDDWEQMLETLAALYANGVAIDWAAFDAPYSRRKLVLPTYAFQRQRYWIETTPARPAAPEYSDFADAIAAGDLQSDQGPLDLALHTYGAKLATLERLTTGYMLQALRSLGAYAAAGERHNPDTLIERFGILPSYRKPLTRWFNRLCAEGILVPEGDAFAAPAGLPDPAIDDIWADAGAIADMPYLVDYIRRSGDALPRMLQGKESALAILFPGGNVDGAEALYERSAPSRYMNGIARAVASAFAGTRVGRRPVNVLELGAGTGGTSSAVLAGLPRTGVTYWYTDLSDFFLARAANKFKKYDFIRYGILNIENDPEAQGYRRGAFDVILAANVLHATLDLRKTLENARSLLAPGGILLLLEDTEYHSYFDITVAMIDGWQRFEDDLRGDHPLVAVEQWHRALRETGFADVVTFPREGSAASIVGQTIIMARPPLAAADADASLPAAIVGRAATARADAAAAAVEEDLLARLADAPPTEREDLLVNFVRGHVAGVLRLSDPGELGRRQRLMDLGLDSLMAVELRNRLASGIGSTTPLPATLMFDYPTIDAIAQYLGRRIDAAGAPAPEAAAPASPEPAPAASAAAIAELTEEEAEALLLQKLENLQR
jgi:malonyl CoA-acyl carrier protein transacylase